MCGIEIPSQHDNLGAFHSLVSIIDMSDDIDRNYKAKLMEFVSAYPNSIIGKMAKFRLAEFACSKAGGYSNPITDSNIRAYIQQTYDELKSSPILFLQKKADIFLKTCLD
ncbi:MAG: hypothetical protein KGS48_12455 [Bacteroidetes bacterium]|nr:hypothetical protein [Bacteroidota bacterium]